MQRRFHSASRPSSGFPVAHIMTMTGDARLKSDAPEMQDGPPVAEARPMVSRLQQVVLCALLAVFIWVGWISRPLLGIDRGDELTYIALSHSLESGSYRESFRPSAPAHVKYPPGYPAWLVAVRKATGERIDLIPAVNLGLAALSLVMLFGLAKRLEGSWFGLIVIAALVLNHGMLWIGGSYFSEALFIVLTTGALAATMRADGGDRRWAYVAIVLALLAFLTRSAGVAMVFAVGAWLAIGKRHRNELLAYVALSAIVIGGWIGYASYGREQSPVRSYLHDFSPQGLSADTFGVAKIAFRIARSTRDYLTALLPYELALPSIPNSYIDNILTLMLLAICLPVGSMLLWRRSRTAVIYVAVYGAMIVSFPYVASRLLEPIIPLVMLVFLLGAWEWRRQLPVRTRNVAIAALLIAVGIGAALSARDAVAEVASCDRNDIYADRRCYTIRARSLALASHYVRDNAAPGEFALAWRASSVAFLSGHQTESELIAEQFPSGYLADSLRVRNIRYVILTPISNAELGPLSNALLASCMGFRLEHRYPGGVMLFSPTPSSSVTDDACAALTDFKRRFRPEE